MKLPNIFLHFLNKDTLEIFGILDTGNDNILKKIKKGLNASILLCNDYCFMPLGFYFECRYTYQLILQSLDFVNEGLLRFCVRESDLKEYVEKKQGQLKNFSNDVTYHNFYNKDYVRQLDLISPTYLQRNVKVGEYCIDQWIKQHSLFLETRQGDLRNIYSNNSNEDLSKIIKEIKNAAINVEGGAFIWSVIQSKYDNLNIRDRILYNKLREYFEKNYYEAYLKEYDASILYDFFLIDRGQDFSLYDRSRNIINFNHFNTFLKMLGLEICLSLPAAQVIELKYFPEYTELFCIYVDICSKGNLCLSELRENVSRKTRINEDNINMIAQRVRENIIKGSNNRKDFLIMEKERIDVLIIIATEEEEKAIIHNDNWNELKTKKGYTYYLKKQEKMTFALARAIDMRETETSVVGQYFIDELTPQYLAMAGFCAGQAQKTVLGDVIVPYKVYRYGQGKRTSEDITLPEVDSYKMKPIWKQKVERFGDEWRKTVNIEKPVDYEKQKYCFMTSILEEKEFFPSQKWESKEMPDIPKIIEEFKENQYITIKSGKVVLTEEGKNEFENLLLLEYWSGYKDNLPSTKVGVLATGDDVQEWSGVFDELARNYDRKTIALDMEAHAIGAISAFNNIPFIIAKGVGDFAKNGKKFDNRYIEYACKMSCNFIISFFESLDEVELI